MNFAKPTIIHLDLERGWRGGERQVLLLVQGLAELDFAQAVVGRRNQPLAERVARDSNVATKIVDNRLGALFYCLSQASRLAVFHAHTGNTIPLAVVAAKTKGAKSVVTRRLDLPPRRYFIRRADHVVAISSAVRQELFNVGVDSKRLSTIHSAVEPPPTNGERGQRADLRQKLGLKSETPLILSIGALVDQKDPLTAVRMLQQLPDAHLLWVGDGELRQNVQDLANELSVSERIHWHGFDENPNRWFVAADIFCLPSRHEGLGTVYLDAFLHRVPVVGTDISGSSDVLIHNRTALRAKVGDHVQLAAAIQAILNNDKLRQNLVDNAHQHAAAFSVKQMVTEYSALYEALFAAK